TTGWPISAWSSGTVRRAPRGTPFPYTTLFRSSLYAYRVCAADKAGNISSGATASATPQAGDSTAPTGSLGLNGGAAATNSPAVKVGRAAAGTAGALGYRVATCATVT